MVEGVSRPSPHDVTGTVGEIPPTHSYHRGGNDEEQGHVSHSQGNPNHHHDRPDHNSTPHHVEPTSGAGGASFLFADTLPKQQMAHQARGLYDVVDRSKKYDASPTLARVLGSPSFFYNLGPSSVTKDEKDVEAEEEYKENSLPMRCTIAQLEKKFGFGIAQYFWFVKFICWSNVALGVVASVSFLPHLGTTLWKFPMLLFVEAYDDYLHMFWLVTSMVSLAICIVLGPLYSKLSKTRANNFEKENEVDGDGDVIRHSKKYRYQERMRRKTVSYAVFAFLISAGASVNVVLLQLSDDDQSTITAFLVTGSVVALNALWKRMAIMLTKYEKHETWTAYRKHEAVKLFSFKICNVMCMYLVQHVAQDLQSGECQADNVGTYFLLLIIIDGIAANFSQLFGPTAKYVLAKFRGSKMKGSNQDAKPEFDVSEDYLQLLYRQFIVQLGMLVFPTITIIGAMVTVLEYWLDKYRLLRLSAPPHELGVSLRRTISTFLAISTMCAIFSFPNGAIFVLTGYRFTGCETLP